MKSKTKKRKYLPNTFGDPVQFKTLTYISEKLNEVEQARASRLARLIFDYSRGCKNVQEMSDHGFRNHVLAMLKDEAISKLNRIADKYDPALLSRVFNLINAKFKALEKKNVIEKRRVKTELNKR